MRHKAHTHARVRKCRCGKQLLNQHTLRKAEEVRRQLERAVGRLGLPQPESCDGDMDHLRRAVVAVSQWGAEALYAAPGLRCPMWGEVVWASMGSAKGGVRRGSACSCVRHACGCIFTQLCAPPMRLHLCSP